MMWLLVEILQKNWYKINVGCFEHACTSIIADLILLWDMCSCKKYKCNDIGNSQTLVVVFKTKILFVIRLSATCNKLLCYNVLYYHEYFEELALTTLWWYNMKTMIAIFNVTRILEYCNASTFSHFDHTFHCVL